MIKKKIKISRKYIMFFAIKLADKEATTKEKGKRGFKK